MSLEVQSPTSSGNGQPSHNNVHSPREESRESKRMAKTKDLAERLGMTLEEAVGQNLSQKQLKKRVAALKYRELLKGKREQEKMKRKKFRQDLKSKGLPVKKLKVKKVKMSESSNKVIVVIDCNFNHLMNDDDIKKLRKQIHRCYSVNRSSSNPVQLYISSFCGRLKEEFEKNSDGFQNWDINFTEKHYLEEFEEFVKKKRVIYLTYDSDESLPETSVIASDPESTVYVVGGLVDHNSHKGLTQNLASEKRINTAKLPIDDFFQMVASRVLTVNQCFEIMLLASNGNSWKDSFLSVIPKRKLLTDKVTKQNLLTDKITKRNLLTDKVTKQKLLTDEITKPESATTESSEVGAEIDSVKEKS